VAIVLDASGSVVHLLPLRESLAFRASSVEALGLARTAERYRARLGTLAATPVSAGS